ncbi:amidohydrolase family protein [Nocardia sp. NBC_00511]|uniref:amidohydrolase family protein n=1 Tax=Nocardia sp. NBC_00511 TaxID=2903591 RepID=UPI0030E45E7F
MTTAVPVPDFDSTRPLLITGATLITLDPPTQVLESSDVLIVDGKIAGVGQNLPRPDATQVFDATGKIVMPGLVDSHQHTWQNHLRGIGVDWSLNDYFQYLIFTWKPHFTPEDIYAGTLLGATEALTHGSTTMSDWSDGAATPDMAEAAAQALVDAGIRGRFTYANAGVPVEKWGTGAHVKQMWDAHNDFDRLVSMQIAIDSGMDPAFPEQVVWKFARDNGIRVATHGGLFGWDQSMWIPRLVDHGLLLPTNMYMHMVSVPDEFIKRVADSGGTIVNAPIGNLRQGQGFPHVLTPHRFGGNIALATNSETCHATSMFDVMRTETDLCDLYAHLDAEQRGYLNTASPVRSPDLLEWATVGGATALGLQDRIGSLTVGKYADLIVLTPDPFAMPSRLDPIGHVVNQGRPELIDLVMVSGVVKRRRGAVVDGTGVSHEQVRKLVNASQERLIAAIGEKEVREAIRTPANRDGHPMRTFLD